MRLLILIIFVGFAVTGCYQISSNGDDLNTVPVTNNPNFVPGAGMISPTAMPY